MTYPQPKDWSTDDSRMEVIMQNGNCGAPYILKSLSIGDKFKLDRTNVKYTLLAKGKTNSKVRNTKNKASMLNNQCVVTKLG